MCLDGDADVSLALVGTSLPLARQLGCTVLGMIFASRYIVCVLDWKMAKFYECFANFMSCIF